jgi:hypothetical protein
VSALVLDAGALVAVERNDRDVHKQIRDAQRIGVPVRTNAMAVAQVWRGGRGRQARLAKVLRGVEIEPIIREDGLRAGELLGTTRLKDAVDASVALLALPGDRILTSDADDLRVLCDAAGNKAVVIDC